MSISAWSRKATKSRNGYMTAIYMHGAEFAIYAQTKQILEETFNNIVEGRSYFDPEKIQRVKIYKHTP